MKGYVAYTRVSTTKQGEQGASLPEQKSLIEEYARKERLHISTWFEEQETAAKVGRTVFKKMVQTIERGGAEGLILHKIDRGARNLRDWATLSELIDRGVDVRIAGDSIDMSSQGGRLSADMLAVMAAYFIRNLREEVKKGQQGRLKQGLYPWGAPMGYLNSGKGGKAKLIDPVKGPIVRRAFEEYAGGTHTLRTLAAAMHEWGIRTAAGKAISLSRVNEMLRRSFYIGLIEVKGEAFLGTHQPLISKALFDRVQAVLSGRSSERVIGKRSYALTQVVKCGVCSRFLYAETQKGHRYYRCHTPSCRGTCVREDALLDCVLADICAMGVTDTFLHGVQALAKVMSTRVRKDVAASQEGLLLRLARNKDRIDRLTDALLDEVVDKVLYAERKGKLLEEKLSLTEKMRSSKHPELLLATSVDRFLELAKGLQALRKDLNLRERRLLMKSTISNFSVKQKAIEIKWRNAFQLLIQASPVLDSAHEREGYRTSDPSDLAQKLIAEVMKEDWESDSTAPPKSGSPQVQEESFT